MLPNLCGPGSLPHEYSMTSPDMIVACVQFARALGATSVSVANHAADYVTDTHAFYEALGIFDLARQEGFNFHNLRYRNFIEDGGLRFAEISNNTDVILNVTLPKTHHQADGVSLALKNFGLGLTDGRGLMHQDISAAIVAANRIIRQRAGLRVIDIIDGRRGMQGMGPHFGKLVDHGFMLIGDDPVGVDATAARLMGFDPLLIRTLLLARDASLGTLEPEILGDIATIPTLHYERSPNWSFRTMSEDRMAVFHLEQDGLGTMRFYRLNKREQRYEPIKAQTKTVSFSPDTTVSEAEALLDEAGMRERIFQNRDVFAVNNNVTFNGANHLAVLKSSLPNASGVGSWIEKLVRSDDLEVRVSAPLDEPGAYALIYNEPAANGSYRAGREVINTDFPRFARFLADYNVDSFLVRRGTDFGRFISCFEAEFTA